MILNTAKLKYVISKQLWHTTIIDTSGLMAISKLSNLSFKEGKKGDNQNRCLVLKETRETKYMWFDL